MATQKLTYKCSKSIYNSPKWKKKSPNIHQLMNKCGIFHTTMEYYSDMQGNEVLTHSTTCMDSDHITLSERSQTKMAHIV